MTDLPIKSHSGLSQVAFEASKLRLLVPRKVAEKTADSSKLPKFFNMMNIGNIRPRNSAHTKLFRAKISD